jgi:hypothetical protein
VGVAHAASTHQAQDQYHPPTDHSHDGNSKNTREREQALAKVRLVYFIDSPPSRTERTGNTRLPQVAIPQKINEPIIGVPIVAARCRAGDAGAPTI